MRTQSPILNVKFSLWLHFSETWSSTLTIVCFVAFLQALALYWTISNMMSLTFASVLNKPKIARVLGIPEKIEHPEDPKAAKDQVWVSSACQSV